MSTCCGQWSEGETADLNIRGPQIGKMVVPLYDGSYPKHHAGTQRGDDRAEKPAAGGNFFRRFDTRLNTTHCAGRMTSCNYHKASQE